MACELPFKYGNAMGEEVTGRGGEQEGNGRRGGEEEGKGGEGRGEEEKGERREN